MCGTSLSAIRLPSILFLTLSLWLAAAAVFTMRKSRLKIFPEPHKNAVLITGGPYRVIRHPMYTALILGCTGLLLAGFNIPRLLLLIALVIVLLIKLYYEESLLVLTFDNYELYKTKTYRLIPFVF